MEIAQNYTNLLYLLIGKQIIDYRERNKISIDNLLNMINEKTNSNIDKSKISYIERGIAKNKKNPYLLSLNDILDLSNFLNISEIKLIIGPQNTFELFIKLIILSIIINNDSTKYNPINNKNSYITEEKNDDFFYNKHNYHLYSKLSISTENNEEKTKPYEKISNMLLKLLMLNINFRDSILTKLENITNSKNTINLEGYNQSNSIKYHNEYLKKLKNFEGNYAEIILDTEYKYTDYKLFVIAFNEFWKKHKEKITDIFKKKITDTIEINIKNEKNPLKQINNKFFKELILNELKEYIEKEIKKIDDKILKTNKKEKLYYESLKSKKIIMEVKNNMANMTNKEIYEELNKIK